MITNSLFFRSCRFQTVDKLARFNNLPSRQNRYAYNFAVGVQILCDGLQYSVDIDSNLRIENGTSNFDRLRTGVEWTHDDRAREHPGVIIHSAWHENSVGRRRFTSRLQCFSMQPVAMARVPGISRRIQSRIGRARHRFATGPTKYGIAVSTQFSRHPRKATGETRGVTVETAIAIRITVDGFQQHRRARVLRPRGVNEGLIPIIRHPVSPGSERGVRMDYPRILSGMAITANVSSGREISTTNKVRNGHNGSRRHILVVPEASLARILTEADHAEKRDVGGITVCAR